MTQPSSHQPEDRIADAQADAVLELAARYTAEQQDSYSEQELIQAGSEVNIPPEFTQKAIREIEGQQRSTTLELQRRLEQRRLLTALAGAALAITAASALWAYNAVLSASARVDAAWAQVENQMQRRADLLPSLLVIASAPNQHNRAVVDALQGASQTSSTARTSTQLLAASQQVDRAVAAFNSSYLLNRGRGLPQGGDLLTIQYELTGTANRLAVERMRFNQSVDASNRTISLFPLSLVANAMGMKKQAFMQPPSPSRRPANAKG